MPELPEVETVRRILNNRLIGLKLKEIDIFYSSLIEEGLPVSILIGQTIQEVITSGIVERIGLKDSVFTIAVTGEKKTQVLDIKDHAQAVNMLLEALVNEKIVKSLEEIDGVGHRVVHGGEAFEKSVVVDDRVLEIVTNLSDLAPLHNPANLTGYYAFKEALPHVGNVFVFDTAFHQTMKPQAYLYPVPYDYYTKYGVRKYGFHGTSHLYVSQRTIELLGNPTSSKIITCHLGNGASLCAIKDGVSMDTSMGFTPLAGVMGFLKGKSSQMIYERWSNARYKYRNRSFWCRGYYVDTVGKNTKAIKNYIANQLKEDHESEQLVMDLDDPFKGKK